MSTTIYSDTDVSHLVKYKQNEVERLRNLEKRAQDLQMMLWDVEKKWQTKVEKLLDVGVDVAYNFHDTLC